MVFSFFALGGAIRLYKFFYHYFPEYNRELALATLFLPSVAFWSAGLLKDSVCFGAVGYLVYAIFSLFVRRKKIFTSLIWAGVAITLLLYIKPYIFLALAPAIVLWLFSEFNKTVENKTLRQIMGFLTFTVGGISAFFLIQYLTSSESLQAFRLESFLERSQYNRDLYQGFSEQVEGSYFTITTTNPVLLVLSGIIAVLFRPFLWEVNSPTALLSALESLGFLLVTVSIMYKRGFIFFFRKAFENPVFLMCITFTLVFAAAVGSTATNFGSISRYKIPAMPFYLIMILIMYRQAGLGYPKWFRRLLGYKIPPRWHQRQVQQKPT
jgi:hypothetical protein